MLELITTSHLNRLTNFHTVQITTAHTTPQSVIVFIGGHCLVTASNNECSSALYSLPYQLATVSQLNCPSGSHPTALEIAKDNFMKYSKTSWSITFLQNITFFDVRKCLWCGKCRTQMYTTILPKRKLRFFFICTSLKANCVSLHDLCLPPRGKYPFSKMCCCQCARCLCFWLPSSMRRI
jgi:hypothetical protein